MTGFLDWAGRVVMLVLAGMITLSIIGAIASIPSGSIETRIGFQPREWPRSPSPQDEPLPRPGAEAGTAAPATSPVPSGDAGAVAAPAPDQPVDPGRWLEAITYALLAIAGLAALGLILLWRALGHWRRSADALEALAPRG